MITTTIFLIFIGSFLAYLTSEKVVLQNTFLRKETIKSQKNTFRVLGIVILLMALFNAVYGFGLSSGILLWLFTLTLVLSFLIILNPTLKFNYKYILVVLLVSILIEYFF